VSYTLKVSPNAVGSGYAIKYAITSATDFVQTGFYGEDKTVARVQEADLVDVSLENKAGINLTILENVLSPVCSSLITVMRLQEV